MSKFDCSCGNVINDNMIPNPIKGFLSPDYKMDYLGNYEHINYDMVLDSQSEVLECKECGRLWIESEPGKWFCYIPENKKYNKIMKYKKSS